MMKLEESAHIKRKIRQDDLEDLGTPTWVLLREAIVNGRTDRALELLEYSRSGLKNLHDSYAAVMALATTYVADTFGEDEVPAFWREQFGNSMEARLPNGLDALEEVEACVVRQRQHQGPVTIVEEHDRFVAICEPCGSGGKLMRDKIGGVTKKAYPWSWNQVGIPYYCTHCSVMWEIMCNEIQGFPQRINVRSNNPNDPCYNYFYKKPELIPDEYFTRVGMKKTIK